MMNKKYITVVFEYDEGAELPKKLTKAFADNAEFEDSKITAVSLEDEFSRIETLEKELEESSY